jgi:predicted DsbA family dithiol-disulfide isomerase
MRVEIWSDVVCPWCYIGKRRFERALAEFDGRDDVEVVFRPFQLDPTAPPGSTMPVVEAYARKFGGVERATEMMTNVTDTAAGDGLSFHLERAQRANTRDAHRVLAFAEREHGPVVQAALKEALLRAYFVEGRNVGDHDTLVELAGEAGLDRDRVATLLDGTEGIAELQAELDEAQELGITAVPTFVFDGRWAVPGAQDPELLLRALRRTAEVARDEAAARPDAEAAAGAGALDASAGR